MKNDDPGFPRSFLCILDTEGKKRKQNVIKRKQSKEKLILFWIFFTRHSVC